MRAFRVKVHVDGAEVEGTIMVGGENPTLGRTLAPHPDDALTAADWLRLREFVGGLRSVAARPFELAGYACQDRAAGCKLPRGHEGPHAGDGMKWSQHPGAFPVSELAHPSRLGDIDALRRGARGNNASLCAHRPPDRNEWTARIVCRLPNGHKGWHRDGAATWREDGSMIDYGHTVVATPDPETEGWLDSDALGLSPRQAREIAIRLGAMRREREAREGAVKPVVEAALAYRDARDTAEHCAPTERKSLWSESKRAYLVLRDVCEVYRANEKRGPIASGR